MAPTPLLEVDSISVAYGEERALFDVSLRLAPGRAIAVLGANGAGKTSLAAAIVGMVRPASGAVRFDGVDITRWPPHRISRAGIAYVPEGRGIYPHLTVIEILTVLVAQRSYYSAQQTMVQTKLTAAQNIVDIYQSIGGDTLLQATPVCQALPGDTSDAGKPAPLCTP